MPIARLSRRDEAVFCFFCVCLFVCLFIYLFIYLDGVLLLPPRLEWNGVNPGGGAVVSRDCATALRPGRQERDYVSKKKKRISIAS